MKNKHIPEIRFPGFTGNWKQCKLGELAEIVRGASPRPIQDPKWFDKNSDVGWLRISDVTEQDGRIHYLEQKISKAGQEKTRVLTEPHLLLSIAATVGKPVLNYVKTGVHDGFLIFMNPSFYKEFMFQWLEMFRPKWKKYGQPGSQVNLNSELVRNQDIKIPSLEEQKKIGEFLKQLDDMISFHQQELTSIKQTKQGFLQKMFPKEGESVPEIRFPGFTGDWKQHKLGDLLEERNEQVPENDEYKLMSFTATEGVTPKSDRYNREFLVKSDNKKYKKTEKGDIIYSSNNLEVGAIGLNNMGKAVISPVYSIFYVKNGITPEFIGVMIQRKEFINKMLRYRQGVVYGQWRIHESDFLTIETLFPSSEEQVKIGNFFKKIDSIIDLHQRELDALKKTKKAFLQKMFV